MIQVELHDPSNKLVQVFSGAKAGAYYEQLNSDGVGSFKIHRTDKDALGFNILQGGIDGYLIHLLRKPTKINPSDPEPAFVDRFTFVVEGQTFGIDKQEDANAWFTVSGRGSLCLLEDRLAFPPGFDGVNPSTITSQWQQYVTQPGGSILAAELDRSNPRFATQLTHTLIQDTDSQTIKLRFDNLRKLHDYLVQNGPMDARMVGLDYQAFNQLGTDKSAQVAIQLSRQDSLLALQLERDLRNLTNWVIAQGTAEGINAPLAVASDAPSITAIRRREGFVDTRNTDNAAQLQLVANGAISQFKAVDQRITINYFDSLLTQLYRDFSLGDFVNLKVALLNWVSKYRVVGIQVADPDTATSGEYETVSLDLNDVRTEYLLKLQKSAQLTSSSLRVLNTQPQGAAYNDSFGFPWSADATHPWRVKRFIPSNLLKLNYCKLSFSLGAFQAPVAATNNPAVTSGASSAASSGATSTNHVHQLSFINAVIAWPMGLDAFLSFAANGAVGTLATGNMSADHTHLIPHTHNVTSNVTLTYGIFEGTTATNVKVLINGTDRTVALGGAAGGFTIDQAELEISQWLTIGAWNTFELQPSILGLVHADVRMTGYIQSA